MLFFEVQINVIFVFIFLFLTSFAVISLVYHLAKTKTRKRKKQKSFDIKINKRYDKNPFFSNENDVNIQCVVDINSSNTEMYIRNFR